MAWHVAVVAVLIFGCAQATTGGFLPRVAEADPAAAPAQAAWRAWLEPRTVLIGIMVFALAVTEGTANDWLAVALIDGYDVPHWMGVAGFGLFLAAMTLARVVGPVVLDRYDRVPVLWATMAAAALGVVVIVYGGPLAPLGIVLWGLGASLGFPVGMSAASDDEVNAPARVSVVSTIAFLACRCAVAVNGHAQCPPGRGDPAGALSPRRTGRAQAAGRPRWLSRSLCDRVETKALPLRQREHVAVRVDEGWVASGACFRVPPDEDRPGGRCPVRACRSPSPWSCCGCARCSGSGCG